MEQETLSLLLYENIFINLKLNVLRPKPRFTSDERETTSSALNILHGQFTGSK
jgi:hypothetical protein